MVCVMCHQSPVTNMLYFAYLICIKFLFRIYIFFKCHLMSSLVEAGIFLKFYKVPLELSLIVSSSS